MGIGPVYSLINMKKVLKYTLPVCISAFSFAQESPKFEDRTRVEKALKDYKINPASVKIETSYHSEVSGGFVAVVEVIKAFKLLNNTLTAKDEVEFKNDEVSSINLKTEGSRFKLNGATCKSDIRIKYDKLCRCEIAESFDFGNGFIVSPPAMVSFESGKPKFFFKPGMEKWEYKGKQYKFGYYKPGKNGELEKMDSDEGDKWVTALCLQ